MESTTDRVADRPDTIQDINLVSGDLGADSAYCVSHTPLRSLSHAEYPSRLEAPFPDDSTSRQALFVEFTPLVRKLIRQYGDDPDLRQDLVGEIYFRFCKLLDAYDPDRNIPLRPYLVRQLVASTYTFARHAWRERRREVRYEELPLWSATIPSYDPTRDWDDILVLKQMSCLLPVALAKLPTRQKKVVIWRYFEDMPFEQIAGNLGIQAATARSLLRHALNRLRRHFATSQHA